MAYRDWTPEDKAIADRVYSKIARPNIGRDDKARWIFIDCHGRTWNSAYQVSETIKHVTKSCQAHHPDARY